ncbi:MAG: insulinase family protein, partial [Spirosomaceae bacterium]|nr:insulinase family protein [Spirosomataceae bacterium]
MKNTIYSLLLFCFTSTFTFAQGYQLPNYQRVKLPNGLTVYLMEQKEVPLISVSAIVPAGAIYDGDKSGLASLTATALQHGTKNMTKSQLDEEVDFIGANINTYSSKESAGLTAAFAAKDKEKMLGIIRDVLLNPTFDADEFEKEKKRLLVNLEQQKESPRGVLPSYFDKMMYGNHVYGNVVQGQKSTVENLTVQDIKTFYANNYQADGSAIAVVGDFNLAEMKVTLTKLFGEWKKGSKPTSDLAAQKIQQPKEANVLLINKDDARETTFYIGSPGISRNNPDYIAIDVINTLFGGRFTSMLNDELRVNSGLTYGARSNFSALKNGGTFAISTFTANKTTEAAIDKALEVLDNLHKNGIDEKSLTSAKNYVKGCLLYTSR